MTEAKHYKKFAEAIRNFKSEIKCLDGSDDRLSSLKQRILSDIYAIKRIFNHETIESICKYNDTLGLHKKYKYGDYPDLMCKINALQIEINELYENVDPREYYLYIVEKIYRKGENWDLYAMSYRVAEERGIIQNLSKYPKNAPLLTDDFSSSDYYDDYINRLPLLTDKLTAMKSLLSEYLQSQ